MDRLFWGLIFVVLDWKFTLGTAVFEILPDFLGFYLLMKGMEESAGRSRRFDRGRHWAFALALACGVHFGAELMAPGTETRVIIWVAGLLLLAMGLALIRGVLRGMGELSLETAAAEGMWPVLAALQSICYLAGWIPVVGEICDLVSLGTGLLFLLCCYRAVKRSAG